MTPDNVPRMRMTSIHTFFQDLHTGHLTVQICYLTENCDDAAIENLLDLIETRRPNETGNRLISRCFLHFKRYPERIKVTSIYEVNA